MIKPALLSAFLTMAATVATAQTNLDYWVQTLDFSLTGLTNRTASTNGIVARVRGGSVRIASRDIIQALNNKPMFALGKTLTNFTVIVTNHVPGPNTFTTNEVVMALPVSTPVAPRTFSSNSKLLYFEPLGTNGFESSVVVRDPNSSVDFDVSRYFQFAAVSFDGSTNTVVSEGSLDIVHDVVSASENSVERVVFDDNAFATEPATGLHFDVQGFVQERTFSLVENGEVVDNRVTRSMSLNAAGTGQIGGTNAFAVLRGPIRITGGKHEVK